jgi:hypothetical protein
MNLLVSFGARGLEDLRKQQNKINRQGVKQFKKNSRKNRRAMITWEEVNHA